MNTRNLTTRTLSLLLVLLMVFCMVPMQAFAADNAADLPTGSEETVTYSRVTSISNGNEYVITMYSCGLYYVLSHANNTLTPVEITVSDNEIDSEITEDMVWTMKNNKPGEEAEGDACDETDGQREQQAQESGTFGLFRIIGADLLTHQSQACVGKAHVDH